MKKFEDYIKSGEVRIQEKNKILASALIKSAEKNIRFVGKLEINDENAEHIASDVYDIIREHIEAKLSLEGYKSYSHEATLHFLARFKEFTEPEIEFLDNLRRTRNGIKYYGKQLNSEEAKIILSFLDRILPKLKKLLA